MRRSGPVAPWSGSRLGARILGGLAVAVVLLAAGAAGSPAAPAGSCRVAWRVFAHSARVPPLSAVAARSDQDVWAVGGTEGGISTPVHEQAAIVHWDGHSLSTTWFPWRDALLRDVAVAPAGDAWSVGSIGKHALALHWDGLRWSRVSVWPWSGAWLSSVAVITPEDVWAVGGFRKRPLVAHWNGRRWSVNLLWGVAPNNADLSSVAASPTGVWASGEDGLDAPTTFGFGDLEVRWDGHHWRRISGIEHSNYDNVANANAVAPNGEVWELSSDYSGNGVDLTRWAAETGKELSNVSWEPESLPDLNAIAPQSGISAVAVGTVETPPGEPDGLYPLVAQWNGRNWRQVHTAFDHVQDTGLYDIVELSPTDSWAVGNHLIVRRSC